MVKINFNPIIENGAKTISETISKTAPKGRWVDGKWVTDVAKSFEEGKVYTKTKPVFEGEGAKDVLPSVTSHVDTVFPSMSASEMIARSTVKPMRVTKPTTPKGSPVKPMKVVRQQFELPQRQLTGKEATAFLSNFEKSHWAERTGTGISDDMLLLLKKESESLKAFDSKKIEIGSRSFEISNSGGTNIRITELDKQGYKSSTILNHEGNILEEIIYGHDKYGSCVEQRYITSHDGLTKLIKFNDNGESIAITRDNLGNITNIMKYPKNMYSKEEPAITIYNRG